VIKTDSSQAVIHFTASTVKEAVAQLNKSKGIASIVSGGVDLVHRIKKEVIAPQLLIDIKNIPGMSSIKKEPKQLVIGALTTIHEIETSPVVRSKFPMLRQAAGVIASPQIRNMSTIGGNLCQQVWCMYYRRSPVSGTSFDCLRKGGRKCFAVAGDNANHAIIGSGKCRAVCPSDMATVLTALSATLNIAGPGKSREISLEGFYTDTGNSLLKNEIITGINIPLLKAGTYQHFSKFSFRKAIDFAVCSVAAVITFKGSLVDDCSIVLGGIALAPFRAVEAEKYLRGKKITAALAEKAAVKAVELAKPLRMNGYKLPLAQAMVKRAVTGAAK